MNIETNKFEKFLQVNDAENGIFMDGTLGVVPSFLNNIHGYKDGNYKTAFATHFKSFGSKLFSFIVCSSLFITFDGLADKSSTAFLLAFTRRT
jgi:hypothetical protein